MPMVELTEKEEKQLLEQRRVASMTPIQRQMEHEARVVEARARLPKEVRDHIAAVEALPQDRKRAYNALRQKANAERELDKLKSSDKQAALALIAEQIVKTPSVIR